MSEIIVNYMTDGDFPDLQSIGYVLISLGFLTKRRVYRHKTIPGLRIDTRNPGLKSFCFTPSYETEAKIDRYLIGNITEEEATDNFYPCDMLSSIKNWTKEIFEGHELLKSADYQLALPDDLRDIRKMAFEFEDDSLGILDIMPCHVLSDNWRVSLEHQSGHHRFTFTKVMTEEERTAKGIRYWFRMIKKWYKDPNNPALQAVKTVQEACRTAITKQNQSTTAE